MKTLALAIVLSSTNAFAWGEDYPDDNHSTAHYDMALAIARCTGFSPDDARVIAEADQATDTYEFGTTAFTFPSRENEYKSYFHFPEAAGAVDGNGDGPLRAWAEGGPLPDVDLCDADGLCCRDGQCVAAGSNEAIGIWMHAVGDYWSHHACVESGGTDHGHFDDNDPDQTAYCANTMHSKEWGRRDPTGTTGVLQANAIIGLQTMRAALGSYAAARGLTECKPVTDEDLLTFASGAPSTMRISIAMTLYAACDSECPAPPPIDEPSSGGCATSHPSVAFALLLLFLRRRR